MSLDQDAMVPSASDEGKAPKAKKPKKRPSDFEIVRTLLTRTHERKLPYLLKDMGEDSDLLIFSSEEEDGFIYGSRSLSVALFEFTDPELKECVQTVLTKLHGIATDSPRQRIVNVRDQMSELAKTKGESMDVEVETNLAGSIWMSRTDVRGQIRIIHFCKAIDSLFHVRAVERYCQKYRPLLNTTDPHYLYYPYRHPEGTTGSILTLPPHEDPRHPIAAMYPHGFRVMVTRGLDVALDKFLEEFPYPVEQEDIIVFQDKAMACQLAHRIVGAGWRMVLLRPNAVIFPALSVPQPDIGLCSL